MQNPAQLVSLLGFAKGAPVCVSTGICHRLQVFPLMSGSAKVYSILPSRSQINSCSDGDKGSKPLRSLSDKIVEGAPPSMLRLSTANLCLPGPDCSLM